VKPNPMEQRVTERRDSLESFLAEAAKASGVKILDMRPLQGGAIQENWLLDLRIAGGDFADLERVVLRTDAPTGVAASLSRAQEFRLLTVAYEQGVTVPRPLWLCENAEILGRPFYIMRWVGGEAAGHLLVKDSGPVRDREGLARSLGEELGKIHQIRPPRSELDFLRMPDPDPVCQAIENYRRYLDISGKASPALEWGLRWSELHAPETQKLVLVHQDFRTGNYLADVNGLTAVLDWEFCSWGDPMSDVGWFCAKCWRFGRDDREAGGIAGRTPFYEGYESTAGRKIDPEAVAFWEVMAHIRWAVIALQQGDRFEVDGEASLDLALTGRVRGAELAYEILRMTPPERWEAA